MKKSHSCSFKKRKKKKEDLIRTLSKATKCPGEPNSEAISHNVPNCTKGFFGMTSQPLGTWDTMHWNKEAQSFHILQNQVGTPPQSSSHVDTMLDAGD